MKPGKHITKLGRFRLAQRECLAINPSQDADQCIPMLADNLAGLIAMEGVADHGGCSSETRL